MKAYILMVPLVVVGMLQLSGCLPRSGTVPPGGAYLSESAGASFDQSVGVEGKADQNIARFPLQHGFRSPEHSQQVFIAAGSRGLVVSDTGGKTWRVISVPLVQTLDVSVLGNGTWVVSGIDGAGQGFILRSLDEGKSWEIVQTVPVPVKKGGFQFLSEDARASVTLSLARDPHNADRIYAGSSLGTIIVGEQSAKVWKTIHTLHSATSELLGTEPGFSIKRLIPSPHRSGELLLVTTSGSLIRVREGTQSTLRIPRFIESATPFGDAVQSRRIFDVSYISSFPQALFVATTNGPVISRDDGKTWVDLKAPIDTTESFNRGTIAVSPTNSNRLFVAVNHVLYRSEDSGTTWNTFDIGLKEHAITQLLIDPTNAAHVVAIVQAIRS